MNSIVAGKSAISVGSAWKKNTERVIERGWVDGEHGNRLIKAIAVYGRVFLGLSGSELFQYTYKEAISANGFPTRANIEPEQLLLWCRRWSECVEKHYYPFVPSLKEKGLSNEERKADAMTRIRDAVNGYLLAGKDFPSRIRDRRSLVAKLAGCSERTLIKPEYLSLWHPNYLQERGGKNA